MAELFFVVVVIAGILTIGEAYYERRLPTACGKYFLLLIGVFLLSRFL